MSGETGSRLGWPNVQYVGGTHRTANSGSRVSVIRTECRKFDLDQSVEPVCRHWLIIKWSGVLRGSRFFVGKLPCRRTDSRLPVSVR